MNIIDIIFLAIALAMDCFTVSIVSGVITDKYPDKKLAVLSCMDTRLTELLPAALGLKNGDAKIIKNAGGLVISAFDSAMRSLIVAIYELGVEEIMVVAHSHCGACHMSFDHFRHEMTARGVTDETLDTI